jgi:hypothetical protein
MEVNTGDQAVKIFDNVMDSPAEETSYFPPKVCFSAVNTKPAHMSNKPSFSQLASTELSS